MKKEINFILFLFFVQFSFAQVIYEPGYFINLEGKKIDCLIKNLDWDNNPSAFTYKLNLDSEKKEHSVDSVKEFGILGESTYLSEYVQIDISSDNIELLSSERNPIFEKKRIFLKLLVKGKINLLSYQKSGNYRFFYKNGNNSSEQLIYKKFIPKNNIVKTNEFYKQQILNVMQCQDISIKNIKSLKYKKAPLKKFFEKYNTCADSNLTYNNEKTKKQIFHLSPKIGIQNTSANFVSSIQSLNFDFGNNTGVRFGVEAEYTLPYNKNKWRIFIEPSYQNYNPNNENNLNSIDYKSIEIPVGLRHYFFLNNTSFFINAAFVLDAPLNATYNNLEISSSSSFLFGLGFLFDGKYAIELRSQTQRNLLTGFGEIELEYSTNFIFLLSYKFF